MTREDVDQRDPQWLRGLLPLVVLAVLEQGECYGYDLSRQLEAAGLGEVKGGTLYPVLARLERDGLVSIRWSQPSAGPARKYYRLTPTGRTHLAEGTAGWSRFATRVMALLQPMIEETHHATN